MAHMMVAHAEEAGRLRRWGFELKGLAAQFDRLCFSDNQRVLKLAVQKKEFDAELRTKAMLQSAVVSQVTERSSSTEQLGFRESPKDTRMTRKRCRES